jgi:N-acetyl-anhydromuramyl-L-alanine amidase AmpD
MPRDEGRKQGSNSIIICGEKQDLPADIKVVTFLDPAGFSFERDRREWTGKTDSDYFTPRDIKGKKVESLEDLQSLVHMVVLHCDQTVDSRSCYHTLLERGFSTHFMIDWDGTIYQCLDVLSAAWHAAGVNNFSIGIDLNNLLPELQVKMVEGYPPPEQLEENIGVRQVSEELTINGGRYKSYGYTDAQYTSLVALLKTLIKVLHAIKPFPPFDETNRIIPSMLDKPDFEGFLAHWHLNPEKWDPGPGFDWQRVYHGLSREHNSFPVELTEGMNIGNILIPEKVQQEAVRIYENNERTSGGGYYPLGINQNWHGGMHIHARRGSPVYSMMDGVLVAAHFGQPAILGSNNFILLRHDIELPKGKNLKIYSLYMHLDHMALEPDENSPQWLKEAHRTYSGMDEKEEEELKRQKKEDEEDENSEKKKNARPQKGREGKKEVKEQDSKDKKEDKEESSLEEESGQELPFLDIGDHITALKRGQIALFPYKEAEKIKVSSGELIGHTGVFGEEDEIEEMIHVELFTDESWKNAIDLGIHGEFFTEMEEDMGDNLIVETDDILRLFYIPGSRHDRREIKIFKRMLDPSDIEDFYNSRSDSDEESKNLMRKAVTRHVSEWSDQVDWFRTLSKSEDLSETVQFFKEMFEGKEGAFRKRLAMFLPFIWLNRAVAKHIGMEQDPYTGIFFYFHPINFLMWLTFHSSQRIQVISQGKTEKQLMEERKRLAEKIEKQRAMKRLDVNSEDVRDGMHISLDEIRSESKGTLFDEILDIPGQGEWK